MPRDRLHAGDLAVRPDALDLAQTGNRGHDRVRTRGQHNVVRGVADAVDLYHTRACEPPMAANQADATIGEPALLAGVRVIRDHEVAPGECRRDVDFGLRGCLARTVNGLAGTQQRLRRNARPIRALAANKLALNQRHAQAAFRKRTDTVFARRTAPNHDHVEVVHCGSSWPDCSRTM
jgi:hypothetical protein